ncbi:hypothetical protein Tco_0167282 [Tanacetum coccineum]
MPVELGSFDAIIGMDWLAKYQAVIMCAEKIVRIPWRNKTLIIHGDGSTQGNVTRLNIISCTKAQKYMEKGFPIFLAHITAKEVEDKSEKNDLDVPIVQTSPKYFPEDCRSLLPTRQMEFSKLIGTWSSVYSKIDPKFRLSQIKVFREEDIPEDCLQNSLGHYDFHLADTIEDSVRFFKDRQKPMTKLTKTKVSLSGALSKKAALSTVETKVVQCTNLHIPE